MLRSIKALVFLAAALTTSAVVSSAVAAETTYFFANSDVPVTLVGAQHSEKDVFTTKAGTVSCNEATYSGELSEQEAKTVEIKPSYSGCTAFGSMTATFAMNGCAYRLTNVTIEGEALPKGTADIVCPEGKSIDVTVSLAGVVKCTIHVSPQKELSSVNYANVEGSTAEITAEFSVKEKLAYSQTAGTGFGACSTLSAGNGSYEGAAIVAGRTAEEAPDDVALLAADPTFVLNPSPVPFKAQGVWEKVTIENKSKTEEPKLDFMIRTPVNGAHGYKAACEDKTLKKAGNAGDTCGEEVICITQGKVSYLNIGSSQSYAFYKAELKAC